MLHSVNYQKNNLMSFQAVKERVLTCIQTAQETQKNKFSGVIIS